MKASIRLFSMSAVIGFLVFNGCSKLPIAEVGKAKSAIQNAQNAEAHVYAVNQYNSAIALYDSAVVEIDKQNKKLFVSRNYKNAILFLENAEKAANSSKDVAAMNKLKVRSEAQDVINKATNSCSEIRMLLDKVSAQQRKTIETEVSLEPLTLRLSNATNTFAGGNYTLAQTEAEAVIKEADNAKRKISSLSSMSSSASKKPEKTKAAKKGQRKSTKKTAKSKKKPKRK